MPLAWQPVCGDNYYYLERSAKEPLGRRAFRRNKPPKGGDAMIAAARCVVMTIAIPLVACYALAQEVVPTPEPEDAASRERGQPGRRPRRESMAIPLYQRPLVVLDAGKSLDVVQRRGTMGRL